MLVTLNDVLIQARDRQYAVGLFNTTDTDMLEAVISAAEELHSPVIIGTAEVLLPYGSLDLLAPSIVDAARRASVPVVVHFDHGLSFECCMQALKHGFTSIMFDGSARDPLINVEQTAAITRIAHSFGASVEGEIGHVGEAATNDQENCGGYTTVQEATDFVQKTGVDALAIAIGTAHGTYKAKPKLDLNRLREIRAALDTPLVLHGGSGLSEEDFHNAICNGIAKINIYTDLCTACVEGSVDALKGIQPPFDSNDYLKMRQHRVEFIKHAVKEKMILFGSAGKA